MFRPLKVRHHQESKLVALNEEYLGVNIAHSRNNHMTDFPAGWLTSNKNLTTI